MKTADAKTSPSQIQRLYVLRWVSAGSQALVLAIAVNDLGMALHLGPMLAVVLALVAFNLFAGWRCRRPWLVTDAEVFGHLFVDIVALTLMLYFSGGATNPFVSLLLLPLTIAAVMLPGRYAWGTAGLTLGAYSLLMFTHLHWSAPPRLLRFVGDVFPGLVRLTSEHAAHSSSSFGLHLLGTWFNFLVSALIIAFFVVRMAAALRQRNADLALAREEALRREQVLGLGTFAAGAAHQLGTPLSTMAVVINELDRQIGRRRAMSADLTLLRQQIETCKKILSELLGAAGQNRGQEGGGGEKAGFVHQRRDRAMAVVEAQRSRYNHDRTPTTSAERGGGPNLGASVDQLARQCSRCVTTKFGGASVVGSNLLPHLHTRSRGRSRRCLGAEGGTTLLYH